MQNPSSRIPNSNPDAMAQDSEPPYTVRGPQVHPHAQGADEEMVPQPVTDAVILDPEKLPTWQRAFILGPNVRFTRTPGPTYAKRETEGAGEVPPAADASSGGGAAAVAGETHGGAGSYIIGRGNPVWTPPGQATSSPVGDLQRQIVQALHQGEASPAAAGSKATSGLVLPPRTGAPLRVPPRGAHTVTRNEPVCPTVNTPPSAIAPAVAVPSAAPSVPHIEQVVAPASAAIASPTRPLAAAQRISAAVTPQKTTPVRPFAGIPDHLLWEMMSLGASDSAPAHAASRAARTTPIAPSVPTPRIERPAPITTPVATVKPVVGAVIRMTLPPEPVADVSAAPIMPTVPQVSSAPSTVHLYRQVEMRAPLRSEPVASAGELHLAAAPVANGPVPAVEPAPVASVALPQTPAPVETSFHGHSARRSLGPLSFVQTEDYLFPAVDLLQSALPRLAGPMSQEALEQSAGLLESILEDFGVKGDIIDVRPGPVVTLYEFEPAPGVKSSRVINLADDIARSMSALSARVAVVPGRNVIGIELPNVERETVFLRELIESHSYVGTDYRLPLCLGKTIGGEPVIAELAKMPHLLVAGTTGSGKSVAINTMILSLIYHLRPEECRLIMVDPKMLELSVYDGIPHLLTPVVTDPKKAVLALKWAVREMEERYRKMSRLGVRNIDGFNARVAEARDKGETIMLSVPSGFDRATGEQTFEDQELDLTALPYIVVIVDEMADLMMVAGKEIEGAIQRLAQMARAAGIHLIMATQRPSVDVITGTIKANFPTRISFQVTSKIDSRTILGEQGAEHLLGQGDMLHMVGGGRISRVHGPFVSDHEVEKVVAHLKTQGQPAYLGSVTEDTEDGAGEDDEDTAVFDNTAMGAEDEGDDLYERAVKIVQRDKKCSTSYIQRRLSIGYNRAASLVERMEQDGLVGAPNHVGKREILGPRSQGGGEE
ncbi:DNA translocase FtsK [Rhizobium sp. S-51]|uniref:DNA translocase FtsK n=1 Tax=Rhizobium terricola TaxID=2728849 RepID=A0A7Y0FYB6_9HYPH|nr:DNA translocase FtsK [Rhizobium terricola]